MPNTLTITFTNNPNGVYYPNQVVAGDGLLANIAWLESLKNIFLGSVELRVVEAIKKARGKFLKKMRRKTSKKSRKFLKWGTRTKISMIFEAVQGRRFTLSDFFVSFIHAFTF